MIFYTTRASKKDQERELQSRIAEVYSYTDQPLDIVKANGYLDSQVLNYLSKVRQGIIRSQLYESLVLII